MKRRVVVTDYIFPSLEREKAAAEKAGAEFEAFQCKSADDVAAAVKGADVAVVQFAPLDAKAIKGLNQGATILRYGIGFDNIDIDAARAGGHTVGYVPDYCVDEVADHTAALLLALLRRLPMLDASVRSRRWAAVDVAKPLKPCSETLIGFLGFGRIARQVLLRLSGFGFRFAAHDPVLTSQEAEQFGVRTMSLQELFEQADAISLHAPGGPKTDQIVNKCLLHKMKPDAVIVNTARGSLINEADLVIALTEGRIKGAGLDVFATEPLPDDSPLLTAPNVMITPHAAWYSETAIGRLQQLISDDIGGHLSGRPVRCPVPGSLAVAADR